MMLYLLIWLTSSIVIALLLARIIGKGSRVVFEKEESSEYIDWYLKHTDNGQQFWANSEISTGAKESIYPHPRMEGKRRVSQNWELNDIYIYNWDINKYLLFLCWSILLYNNVFWMNLRRLVYKYSCHLDSIS